MYNRCIDGLQVAVTGSLAVKYLVMDAATPTVSCIQVEEDATLSGDGQE